MMWSHFSTIVNQAVNFEKEVIFIGIPKTGTTSVRDQLLQKGRPLVSNPHLNIVQVRDLIYLYLLKTNLGTNAEFPNSNHPTDSDLRNQAKNLFDSFFKFSAVRNPWARAVSMYSRSEGLQLREKMSFDEFCENHFYASDTCKHPTLHHNQYDWLSSEDGDLLVDYIYKVEEFESAIVEINKLTKGRLILRNVKRNRNPKSKSSDYRIMYNEKTKNIIKKRFEKDIDFFKYSF